MAEKGLDTTTTSKITVRFGDEFLQAGFTAIPNLLLNYYARLGITPIELVFIMHIWQHWWTEQDPYPSLNTIAAKMLVDRRQVQRYAASLKRKGFLQTHDRQHPEQGQVTNEYDFSLLIQAILTLAKEDAGTPQTKMSRGG